jgi:hypothetical protein
MSFISWLTNFRLNKLRQPCDMRYLSADPVLLSLLNALPDDEPYTEEQCERDGEAEASIVRGDGVSHQEVLRDLGL